MTSKPQNLTDILRESAQRTAKKENAQLHVPHNPMTARRTYWGWIAAPVAAVIGVIVGLSLPMLTGGNTPEVQYVYATDTIRLDHPVHDTLYLTQTVEKERVVEKIRYVDRSSGNLDNLKTNLTPADDTPTCTSIQCDGINYSMLVSN